MGGEVLIIDTTTDTILGAIALPNDSAPAGIASVGLQGSARCVARNSHGVLGGGPSYLRPAQAGIFARCSRAAFSASGRFIFCIPMK